MGVGHPDCFLLQIQMAKKIAAKTIIIVTDIVFSEQSYRTYPQSSLFFLILLGLSCIIADRILPYREKDE